MFPSFHSALLHILIFFALLLPHSHKMAAMASDIMMSSLHGPLKEENGAKEKEGVRAGERMTPPKPH